jgi:fluoride exporter
MPMAPILQVLIGGAMGALTRYGLSYLLPATNGSTFPWNTFAANLAGCLLIGILYGFALTNEGIAKYSFLIFTGFLGGFTTFSSFGLETLQLYQNKQLLLAVYYVLGTNIAGLLFVFTGYQLSQL